MVETPLGCLKAHVGGQKNVTKVMKTSLNCRVNLVSHHVKLSKHILKIDGCHLHHAIMVERDRLSR